MGGLALLARESGFDVTGSDRNIYPPMSTQLADSGIPLVDGYGEEQLTPTPGCVVVGNALSRGLPVVEATLSRGLRYVSGPEWLGRHILQDQWVLAVAGTHGKTSTASMLAWILDCAGLEPGFLIGGVPGNFEISARLGGGRFFVVEADEYDAAFFDKRSKFVHYRPRTLVINNLEYDHADIFPDLAAIETQFHHLVRCVPGEGQIIRGPGMAIDRVLQRGVWTPVVTVQPIKHGNEACWSWRALSAQADQLVVTSPTGETASLGWSLIGEHNAANATAAIAAAAHVGVTLEHAVTALTTFRGVKRRLELIGCPAGVAVYDDFAHHPTAIASTLEALRAQTASGKLVAVIEPRSNTMRLGEHSATLADCTRSASNTLWLQPSGLDWELESAVGGEVGHEVLFNTEAIIERLLTLTASGDSVVIMSNGGFDGLHGRLLAALDGAV
jgi:UDP-N-acetylmuramate: L-alanyl-gamma-D-glutamyl-meso-diaminopimelate ligase